MNENEFATGSVPVMVAARIYGKDASWVRAGIISGWLPIGKATRNGQLVTKIEDIRLQNAPWLRHIILSVQIWSRELQSKLIENWRSIF